VAEEYCWDGAVMLQAIKFGFQVDSLVYICNGVVDHMRNQIRLARNLLKCFEST
jgi:hypothetical protein